ncbi:MAG: hypothetical protein ACD_82C00028G0001 [uncultured bacterium]|jgi:hypothetical protein|nr:MAG: hypothetical protein ACD_82C00028G0001 [uncultured bacterium]KKP25115.1 MAG: hypothetical protein UR12_C0045G0003 [candidate division TM6 bacterium GW2011_GWF2_30_66]
MNKKIKSIILTLTILCFFSQTSFANPKLYKIRTALALFGSIFGLTALKYNIDKKNSAKNTQKPKQDPNNCTDFVNGKFDKTVLISNI